MHALKLYGPGERVPDAVFRLRAVIWRDLGDDTAFAGQALWSDTHDIAAFHWTISWADEVIAAARLSVHQYRSSAPDADLYEHCGFGGAMPVAAFCRLVVHRKARGNGYAKLLDTIRLEHASALGCGSATVMCSELSGLNRLQAIRDHGFVPLCEVNSIRHWQDRVTVLWKPLAQATR